MRDIYNSLCSSVGQYKAYVKIDFDTFIDKKYLHGVFSFLSKNHEKYLYFGDPMHYFFNRRLVMNGKLYAFSSAVLKEYCNCNSYKVWDHREDFWFGKTMAHCFLDNDAYNNKTMNNFKSDESKIFHKSFNRDGISMKMGFQRR
ncbi:hypothetical protein AYI69_g11098 [Smittium culicis]|uniref:Hexosyltransferase n=1 Tax=Smittium culicis TaxID=133412 RepID=A0A1R1X165_9FUNG|nr:hypothetical protein AYI69_g11118 [Smittium culicis]OMJ08361.1 hypothetical protein AYI69_g11098 [Smittium culicis]